MSRQIRRTLVTTIVLFLITIDVRGEIPPQRLCMPPLPPKRVAASVQPADARSVLGAYTAEAYGAVAGDAVDDSAAISAAMAAAGNGGTVLLRPGYYVSASKLVIPIGVTLMGTQRSAVSLSQQTSPNNPQQVGTVIAFTGSDAGASLSTVPFVTLNSHSVLEGVILFDAVQGLPGTTLVTRSFLVGTAFTSTNGVYPDGPVIRNVSIPNAKYGVRMHGAYRFVIEDLILAASDLGVWVDRQGDTCRISRCHIIPTYWCSSTGAVPDAIQSYLLSNLVAYRFDRTDSLLVSDSMCFEAQTGVLLMQSSINDGATDPRKPWVRFSNCDFGKPSAEFR